MPGILCFAALCGGATAAKAEGAYQSGMLAKAMQPLIDDHTIAGAVLLVADKDKVLAEETVGYANVESKTPMFKDNMFWIASETKSFTTVALMMMVDQGKVNIDDPVSKYLPEFATQQVAEKQADATISAPRAPATPLLVRQLLNHTSCLVQDRVFGNRPDYHLKEYVALLAGQPLQHDPGTHYEYNNSNFETAGRIVEVVSGISYEQFIDDQIIKPLGMVNTVWWASDEMKPRFATGYGHSEDPTVYKPLPPQHSFYMAAPPFRTANPAGGLASDTADMCRFAQMLLNGGELDGHRYIAAKDVRLMGSTETGDLLDKEQGYGYGMMTYRKDHGDDGLVAPGMFGHEGAWSTDFEIDPQDGLAFIIMVQQGGYAKGKGFGTIDQPFWDAAKAAFAKAPRK